MPFRDDDADDRKHPDEGMPEPIEELEPRPDRGEARMREVKVVGVFEDVPESEQMPPNFFVLLRDSLDRRLPILIGAFEAQAIALGTRGNQLTPRPLTHDLLKNTIERLGARVERLTIDDLWQETYYAKLSLTMGDNIVDIDSRPSDGIAIALRAGAPIYVSESVLEEAEKRQNNEEP